jgi:hypothetical protein
VLGHNKGVRKQRQGMMPPPNNQPRSRKKKGKKKKKQNKEGKEHTLITSPGGTSTNTLFSSPLAAIATAPLPSAPPLPPSLAPRHASAMANNEVTFIMIKPDGVQRGLVSLSLSLSLPLPHVGFFSFLASSCHIRFKFGCYRYRVGGNG